MTEQAIDSRLHAAWLAQLGREHSLICAQYRIALQPPVLAISRSRTRLGSWSPAERLLCLSHFLIAEHPWSLTLQVLKHEMAHQMCSEIYHQNRAGHDELFIRACIQLGLEPEFRRAGADLRAGLPTLAAGGEPALEAGRKILDRVRKLLALGESSNEYEAALAIERAHSLLRRHKIDIESLDEQERMVQRTIDTGSRILPSYRKRICALLNTCFGIRVVCASLYHPRTDRVHKTIELLGRADAVAVAEHCYHFLENRLDVLWQGYRGSTAGNRRTEKNSYFLGLVDGFYESLRPLGTKAAEPTRSGPKENQAHGDSPLPVPTEERQLDDFVATRFPRLRTLRGRSQRVVANTYESARAEGRNLVLNPVVASGTNRRVLPTTGGNCQDCNRKRRSP
ncbi:MAG: SprT-like domain-containing protein [Desulfobulbus sp.]